jgi:hypothetical protein
MLRRLVTGIILSQAISFSQMAAQQQFQVEGTTVTVQSVLSMTTTTRSILYQVRLQFRSAGKNANLIGIGPLTGSGELTLFLSEPKLAFRLPDNTLKVTTLTVTGATAGTGELEFPSRADFPASIPYSCRCQAEAEQLELVRKTLATFFFEGVQPQTIATPYQVITRFHDLGMPPPVIGKVAMMIEYPVGLENKHVGFRVSWIARESRIKSPETSIAATDKAILSKAEDYVRKVISSLEE